MNRQAVIRVYSELTGEIIEKVYLIHVHPTGNKLDYIGHKEFLKYVGELIGHLNESDKVDLKDYEFGFKLLEKGKGYSLWDDTCRPDYTISAEALPAIRGAWNQYNNKEV